MNKIFRVVWSHATQSWVAVSELTSAKGKTKSKTARKLTALAVASGSALLAGNAFAATSTNVTPTTSSSTAGIAISPSGTTSVTFTSAGTSNPKNIIVIGNQTSNIYDESILIGNDFSTQGRGSNGWQNGQAGDTVVGNRIRLGSASSGNDSFGTVMGYGAQIAGPNVVLGVGARADIGDSGGWDAVANAGVAIGDFASIGGNQNGGTAIGAIAQADNANSVAIGQLSGATRQYFYRKVTGNGGDGAIYNLNESTGSALTSLGYKAAARNASGIAIGNSATTSRAGGNGVAMGTNAAAIQQGSIALGNNAVAGGHTTDEVTALNALITSLETDATNNNGLIKAQADLAEAKTAMDANPSAENKFHYASAKAGVERIQLMINRLKADVTRLSSDNNATVYTVAIGDTSKATASQAVALGYGTNASGTSDTALGPGAVASGGYGTAVGVQAKSSAQGTTAVGMAASASENFGAAFGAQASAAGVSSAAIGPGASATVERGVALGNRAVADTLAREGFNPAKQSSSLTGVNKGANDTRANTYSGLTGNALTSTLAAVSVGSSTNTRQINHVAAGTADDDAVNVAQLRSVNLKIAGNTVNNAAPVANSTNSLADVLLDNQTLNVVSANTDVLTTDATNNTITLTPTLGTVIANTNGSGSVTTSAAGLMTAAAVTSAINASGWNLAADGTNGVELINPADTVTFVAGKNMQVTRDAANITYATKDDVNFNSVQFGDSTGPKIDADNGNIRVAASNGNPVNITNVEGNLNGAKTGTTGDSTSSSRPSTLTTNAEHNAATVGDVLNAGWNLQGNGSSVDFVRTYDTVNFVDGNGTTVSVTTDDNKTNSVKVNVKSADENTLTVDADGVKVNTGSINQAATSTAGDTAGQVSPNTGDENKVATVQNVAEAINSAYWKTTSGISGTGARLGDDATTEAVKAGELVTFNAGDNLKIQQAGQDFTYSLNPVLTNLTSADFGTGNASATNPRTTINAAGTTVDNGTTKTTTAANGVTITPSAGDAARNVTLTDSGLNNGGNNITNVAGHLNGAKDNTQPDTTAGILPSTTDAPRNNAATVGDVLNAGWNLQQDGEAKDFVRPFDTVNFVKGNGTTVTITNTAGTNNEIKVDVKPADSSITVNADGVKVNTSNGLETTDAGLAVKAGDSTITVDANGVKVNTGSITAAPTDTSAADAGKVSPASGDDAKVATVANVADAINSAYWKATSSASDGEVSGTSTEAISAGDTVTFDAGKNMKITQDAGKFSFATQDDVNFNSVQFGDNGPKIQANGSNIQVGDKDGNATSITNVASTLNTTPVTTAPTGTGSTGTATFVNLNSTTANPVNPNAAATVGDLQNMGWVVSASDNGYVDAVKNANTVDFVGTNLATVSGETKGGVRTITVDVNAQRVVDQAQKPVVYTNAVGDKLVKVGDSFYRQADIGADGNPTTNATPVAAGDVIASMNNGGDSSTTPMTLSNVKSNLPSVNDTTKVITNPDGTTVAAADANVQKAPLTATEAATLLTNSGNNAATLSDVLSAGWNLQGNGNSVDFVKPYDTVNFVDGKGTKAMVSTDDNLTSNVTFNIDNGVISSESNGAVTGPVSAAYLNVLNAAKAAQAALPDTATDEQKAQAQAAVDAAQAAVDANGGNQVATAQNVADAINNSGFTLKTSATTGGEKDSTSTGDELINPSDVVEMVAGKNLTVKQEANGKVTYATKDDVNFNSVQFGDNGPKIQANGSNIQVGDKDGNPTSITNVKSALSTSPVDITPNGTPTTGDNRPNLVNLTGDNVNANAAATVGDLQNMGWIVSADGGYRDVVKNANEVKFVGNNLAKVSGETKGGVRTITVDVQTQRIVEDAQNPVVYTNAAGEKLSKATDGQFYRKVDVNDDGTPKAGVTPVATGDVIASMNNGGNSSTTPMTLTNIAGNLNGENGKAADTTAGTLPSTTDAPRNNAATVGDVLNAGWNLQGNGTAKDFVRAYDTVNFVNGKGTKAVVTTNAAGTSSNVKFDIDNGVISQATDAAGNVTGAVTGPTVAAQAALTAAQAALNALPASATAAERAAAEERVANAQAALNAGSDQVATADNVADAINNSGFTLKTSATADGAKDSTSTGDELINPSDVVEMVAGKNLTVKQEANGKVTYATKDDVNFNSVQFGDNGPKISADGDNIKVGDKDGNPTSITNVKSALSTNPVNTNPNGTPTTGDNRPNLVDLNGTTANPVNPNAAATVGDLQNMGWVVSSDKTTGALTNAYSDVVKNANEVRFVGTGLATVSGKTEGNVRTITVDVNANGGVNGTDASSVTNPNALMTAQAVADAIKASGFTLKTSAATGGTKVSGSDEVINPGKVVDMTAGKNMTVTQGENGKVTYATKDDVEFNSVKLGDTVQGGKQAVNLTNEAATRVNNNSTNNTPSTALNITSADGKPTQIKGVASSLNTTEVITAPNGSANDNRPVVNLVDLNGTTAAPVNPNAAATVGDLQNMGWVIGASENGYVDTVKNANKVDFKGGPGISVTGNTVNGVREITVAVKTGEINSNNGSASGSKDGFVTGDQVSNAINNASWNLVAAGTDGSAQIKPTNTVTFNAGKNMQVVRDGANITYATKDDVNFNSVQLGDNGPTINNLNGAVNVNGAKITGVADGDISPDSTEAVNGRQIYALTGGNNTTNISPVTVNNPDGTTTTYNNVVVDKDGNPILRTYNVEGQKEIITNSVVEAIQNMNEQGIKFFHSNDGIARPKAERENNYDSSASGQYATAIGSRASAEGTNAVAIGVGSVVSGNDSISIGTGNQVIGNNSGAFGDPSIINGNSSYSVGNNNTVATDNTFVLGNEVTRTAANSVFLGTQSGYVEANTNADGSINTATSTTAGTKALTQQVTGGVLNQYAGGQESEVVGVVSVGTVGQDANGNTVQQTRRVQNVAPGLVSEKSTDAINGSQLYSVASNFNNRLGDMNNRINRNNKDLRAGIAGANAAAGLPQVYVPGKSMVAASAGTFKGQSALAVGYSRASDNGKVILKLQGNANTRGDIGGSVGVGYQW